jgi:t-SNARE complex subunit (syntaxin)
MVDDQDEHIDKIGSNVTTARVNVERGVEEITKANTMRKEQRWRYYLVLGLIVLAALLAVGGIALAIFLPKS